MLKRFFDYWLSDFYWYRSLRGGGWTLVRYDQTDEEVWVRGDEIEVLGEEPILHENHF